MGSWIPMTLLVQRRFSSSIVITSVCFVSEPMPNMCCVVVEN